MQDIFSGAFLAIGHFAGSLALLLTVERNYYGFGIQHLTSVSFLKCSGYKISLIPKSTLPL